MHQTVQQQIQLPFKKVVELAWKSIRVRLWRSLLVTSGIVLAIAFLTYILCSESILQNLMQKGSPELIESLKKTNKLSMQADTNAQIQTWWLVGLALLVSFVGILNSMLMSVTERFGEIGTMKCLGALDSFIIKLFVLESAFQGGFGTALGIAVGVGLAYVEGSIAYGFQAVMLQSFFELAQLIGVCLLTGILVTILATLYPAWQAAKMEPVEAMRWEV